MDGATTDNALEWLLAGDPSIRWQAERDPIDASETAWMASRRPDGRWPKGSQYAGLTFFTMETLRVAGRWNTLRARRVLRWWDGQQL